MIIAKRFEHNPILQPDKANFWESEAAFNGCPVRDGNTYHILYRALSQNVRYANVDINISSVGYAKSHDGLHIAEKRQFIKPDFDFEKFGCEDPRVTKMDGKFYIFYTGLSTYPFSPNGIKIALAITRDFKEIEAKYPVTPFNAKAMALFPEKINGKMTAILTAHTDLPPSKIAIATFERESDIWSKDYWNAWHEKLNDHAIPLQRSPNDQIEVGAPPIKTDKGWLLLYCYVRNYFSGGAIFGIEAALLDLQDPRKVIGMTDEPILVPEKYYELYGKVPNVIFPSGGFVDEDLLHIYYGATDTTCCVASIRLETLLNELTASKSFQITGKSSQVKLRRVEHNPIISPNPKNSWESKAAFNPGALYLGGKVRIFYRAMGNDDTSVFGYAESKDGIHVDFKSDHPVYVPREAFEKKTNPGNSGCEDARFTLIGDKVYTTYTAFDGINPPRVALSSILADDLIKHNFTWTKPKLISPPGIDDKNTCIISEKVDGKYIILHRLNPAIWLDRVDDLSFPVESWLRGDKLLSPRTSSWDSEKVGIAAPPIKTNDGWLLIYHGVSKKDFHYRLGAVLLDLESHNHVVARLDYPILEPETWYENDGVRAHTVFACGAVVVDGILYVYYGGADQYTAVAHIELSTLLTELKK